MEPVPTTSLLSKELEPPGKKRKTTHLTESEKNMIIRVFKYVEESWPTNEYPYKQVMKDKTACIVGLSRSTVYRVLKEYNETKTVRPPAKPKRRPSIMKSLDDFDKSNIRSIIHSFYFKGELPALSKVLSIIQNDVSFPKMGKSTLKKLVHHLKFKYVRIKTKSCLTDSDDVTLWRIRYLQSIKKYREQKRPIYYLHEKSVNAGQTSSKIWEEDSKETLQTPDPLAGAKKKQRSKLIIIHVGDEKGFVPGLELMFECKGAGENCKLMNAVKFENWFQTVLPQLAPDAVVVLNYASYHSRNQDKMPSANWTKERIHEWLSSKQISYNKTETKVELLEKTLSVKGQFQSYVVDVMAKKVGVEVLRLPPYHCNLNPIDLVWADVKKYVAEKSATDKTADIQTLLLEALSDITTEKWQNYISHIKKEEIKLSELEYHVDRTIDSIISKMDGGSSTESVSDTEESGSE